jgi:hypothetical protein
MAKLTLNAEREVIEQAKRLAAERKTSVSALFSRFIRVLAGGSGNGNPLGKLTRRASGVIELPKGKSHRDVLADALKAKYGL